MWFCPESFPLFRIEAVVEFPIEAIAEGEEVIIKVCNEILIEKHAVGAAKT